MMLYKLLPRVLVLALLMLTMAVVQLPAEDELVVEGQSGWFGIYIDGQKVGHAAWALERNKGDKEACKLTWEETRNRKVKDKEVKDTVSAVATFGKGLAPLSLKYMSEKAGSKTAVAAQVAEGVAEVTMQLAGQDPLPTKKITLEPDTQFGFCAALVFSLRKVDTDKPARLSRLDRKSVV